eukprot:11227747-Lingulodinium_polyedra.AAC.1
MAPRPPGTAAASCPRSARRALPSRTPHSRAPRLLHACGSGSSPARHLAWRPPRPRLSPARGG